MKSWKTSEVIAVVGMVVALVSAAPPASADPAACQKEIVRQLVRYKRTVLKFNLRCLDLKNRNIYGGDCPDAKAQLKINVIGQKVTDALTERCSGADLTALGFSTTCDFEAATLGVEADCAALPLTTGAELAACLKCWKGAESMEFLAILFASQTLEVCDGTLDETSTVCSDLDCTTPLPDQRDLGDSGENDCQRQIAKGGTRYLVLREKILEKCALKGGTSASCLADLAVVSVLQRKETSLRNAIMRKCGGRDPAPNPPFCCRTGMGNSCTPAATRDDCEINVGGNVQEGKVCGGGNTCDPAPGNKKITWWDNCPESDTCPGPALSTLDDLIDCVQSSATAIADEMLCFQFRDGGWPCPADIP